MKTLCSTVIGVVALLAVGCSAAVALPVPQTATPPPLVQLRVVPKILRPGMRALIVGYGFEGGEQVTFYLIRPDGSKTPEGESTADQSGDALYEIDVTPDWSPGQYVVHVKSRRNPARVAQQGFVLDLSRS